VPLSIQSRRVGEVVVLACRGRIVEGAESVALGQQIAGLLPDEPCIVLDLAGIEFLDSSGIGLLVRLLNRARAAQGDLKLCRVPDRVREILRITKLAAVFDAHAADVDAIDAFLREPAADGVARRFNADVLCVDASADVRAYISEALRQSGYGVLSASNLPDAFALLRASRPKAVVVGAALREARDTWSATAFNDLANALTVIELPADFSGRDAAEAGALLERVRAAIGDRDVKPSAAGDA
jgi:anti-sigma B factor antagonist